MRQLPCGIARERDAASSGGRKNRPPAIRLLLRDRNVVEPRTRPRCFCFARNSRSLSTVSNHHRLRRAVTPAELAVRLLAGKIEVRGAAAARSGAKAKRMGESTAVFHLEATAIDWRFDRPGFVAALSRDE